MYYGRCIAVTWRKRFPPPWGLNWVEVNVTLGLTLSKPLGLRVRTPWGLWPCIIFRFRNEWLSGLRHHICGESGCRSSRYQNWHSLLVIYIWIFAIRAPQQYGPRTSPLAIQVFYSRSSLSVHSFCSESSLVAGMVLSSAERAKLSEGTIYRGCVKDSGIIW